MNKTSLLLALITVWLTWSPRSLVPQKKRAQFSPPQIDVQHYAIQARLNPEAHELSATAAITFKALEATGVVAFEISENLSVQKITTPDGIEVEFGQDESGPGVLSVRFAKPLEAGSTTTIKVEYSGGFDKDRYSRSYSRDEASAYIGLEGTYLLYSAKWFPVNK